MLISQVAEAAVWPDVSQAYQPAMIWPGRQPAKWHLGSPFGFKPKTKLVPPTHCVCGCGPQQAVAQPDRYHSSVMRHYVVLIKALPKM